MRRCSADREARGQLAPRLPSRCVAGSAGPSADADELAVHELLHAQASELTAETGALGAAEGQLGALGADAVDEHHARLQAVGHAQGLRRVGGEDVRAQSVGGVVGELDRRLLVGDAVHHGDRAEQLLAVRRVVRRDSGQHARREEAPRALPRCGQARTLGDRTVDLVGQGLRRPRRGQRRPRPRGQQLLGELLGERVVEGVDDDEPLGGVARLAGVLQTGRHGRVDRGAQVVTAQDDEGVGTAELQHHLLQVTPGDLRHGRTGPLRAGQGYALDSRVGDDRRDLLVAGVNVQVDPGRRARLVEDLPRSRPRTPGTAGRA